MNNFTFVNDPTPSLSSKLKQTDNFCGQHAGDVETATQMNSSCCPDTTSDLVSTSAAMHPTADVGSLAYEFYPLVQRRTATWLPPSQTQVLFDQTGSTRRSPVQASFVLPTTVHHGAYFREARDSRLNPKYPDFSSGLLVHPGFSSGSMSGSRISLPLDTSTMSIQPQLHSSPHSAQPPPLSMTQNISSTDLNKAVARTVRGLKEIVAYQCGWVEAGLSCDKHFSSDRNSISLHFKHRHGIGSNHEMFRCMWPGCGMWMRGDSFSRHIQGHVGMTWECSRCGAPILRLDLFGQHLKRSSDCAGAMAYEKHGIRAVVVDVSTRAAGLAADHLIDVLEAIVESDWWRQVPQVSYLVTAALYLQYD
ncbi:hypothetical protein BV22DRAFT_1052645 [Leucogyrophana mollusca]|uniref:Uncharacterized protein n=1 Tax=Leucogyrophana mollusca TaxID=85980 RepID=A0ACB8AUG6_9AGAM|nr:hypothetical protein BV22DRAFT_1052645 [Leucogyrophana mollusca]